MTSESITKASIGVAIVEDDAEIRANLTKRLDSMRALRFLGSYSDAESALADIPRCKPDVVLMDINLPGIDGVECVRRLKEKMPEVQFVMLTVYEDNNRLFASLRAGASGYLLKRTPPDKILAAILEVHEGGVPMTAGMARRMIQHFQQPLQPSSQLPKLGRRETEVLELLAKGLAYKEIEASLDIGCGTLRRYIFNIYGKLHVHSRTEAVLKYQNR